MLTSSQGVMLVSILRCVCVCVCCDKQSVCDVGIDCKVCGC